MGYSESFDTKLSYLSTLIKKGEGGLKVSTLIFCHFPLIFDDDCQNTVFPLHSQIEKYTMYLRIFRISLPLK